jgi:alpha-amylase
LLRSIPACPRRLEHPFTVAQEAVSRNEYWRLVDARGRPPGLIGLWAERAITFIENHDTGSTLNHWPFPRDHLQQGYAYIVTHPGTPCIFYDHHWSDATGLGTRICELLAVRKLCGIHAGSKVTVRRATADCYAATVDDRLAMKIGYGDYSPNRDPAIDVGVPRWQCTVSGVNFAVWIDERLAEDS